MIKIRFLLFSTIFLLLSFNLSASDISIQHDVGYYSPHYDEPAVSMDGKYFAYAGNQSIRIWDSKGKRIGTFIDSRPYINPPNSFKFWQPNRGIYSLAFLPDNKHLAISVFPRRIYIVDLSGNIVKKYKPEQPKLSAASGRWGFIDQIHYFPNGKKLLTFESAEDDIILRKSNYEIIKRIKLNKSTSVITFKILISPNGKYFVVAQNTASPSRDGWKSRLRLFNHKGKFLKDIETDKPGRIKTPHGKFKREFLYPKAMEFSPDGKYIIYMGGSHFRDPLKRIKTVVTNKKHNWTRNKKVYWDKKVRVYNINSKKLTEFWIPDLKDVVKRVFHSDKKNRYIAAAYNAVYILNKKGEVIKEFKHDKVKYLARNGRKYNRMFNSSDIVLAGNRDVLVGRSNNPDAGMSLYTLKGELIKFTTYPFYSPKNVSVSHKGRFLSFEIERGKKSILWDVKKNELSIQKKSIYYDNWNKEYSLTYDRKKYKNSIIFKNGSVTYSEREHRLYHLLPLPSRKFAELENGFTLYKSDGEAIRRYPKTKIGIDTAIHPKLKFYVAPDTSSKSKKVYLYKLNGKLVRKFYLGAFFSDPWIVSPDGKKIICGHNNQGFIQIFSDKGKLVNRITDLHSIHVKALAITKDNRFLVSVGGKGTVKIIDMKSKNIAEISLFKNNGFIVSDNKGRFDCSKNATGYVSIVKNGKSMTGKLWSKAYTRGLLWKFFQGK